MTSDIGNEKGPDSAGNMPSPVARFFLGLAFVACGMVGVLAAFDVGPLHVRDINGPPWLGGVAGGIFVLGGAFLWAGDAATRYPWLGSTLGLLVLAGLAAIGNWIAFGAGPRHCTGGISGIVSHSWQAGEIECRTAFGIGALLMDGMLVWALGTGMRKLDISGPVPVWIEKLGQGMLIAALAPLLLLLLVIMLPKALFESFLVFCRTGKWPRNEEFIARKKKEAEEARSLR